MSIEYGGLDVRMVAGEAIGQFCVVKVSSGKVIKSTTAASDVLFGVAQEAASADGDQINVRISGVSKVVSDAGTGPVVGAKVGITATGGVGLCCTYASGALVGQRLQDNAADTATASGQVFPVRLILN